MKLRELFAFALGALGGNSLRTGLSLFGMAVGVAAVVVLTALGDGARTYVVDQFTQIGSNLVIVVPGKNETTGMLPGVTGVPNDLSLADAKAIDRQVARVKRIAPITVATETVARGERRRQVAIFGTSREYFEIRDLAVRQGEPLPAGDLERGTPVVVLGAETAKELFAEQNPVGQVVRIGGWRMRVIGVMAPGGLQIGVDLDDLALIPVSMAMKMFNRSSLFRIAIEVYGPADLDPVKEDVRALLTERHGEEDITCLTQDAIVSTLDDILAALTLALVAIAAVSLTVAGVGIMNVMLVSVSERTPEVGLLKALGAERRQILGVFLTEAALMSLAGGLLGLALGWLAVQVMVAFYPNLPAKPPVWAVSAAIVVSMGVGLVFGILPARRAMDLDPVEALAGR